MDFDDDDPVKVYLRELGTAPPLTKEEEAHLFHESAQTDGMRRPVSDGML